MDELLKTVIMQAPAIAVLLFALNRVYTDWKEERAQAAAERKALSDKLDDVSLRLARVERACGADMLPPVKSP